MAIDDVPHFVQKEKRARRDEVTQRKFINPRIVEGVLRDLQRLEGGWKPTWRRFSELQ